MIKPRNGLFLLLIVIVGASLLLVSSVVADQVADNSTIEVFLSEGGNEQVLLDRIPQIPGVKEAVVFSPEETEDLLQAELGSELGNRVSIPAMIQLFVDAKQAPVIYQELQGISGIDFIGYQAQGLQLLSWISRAALLTQVVGLVLSALGLGWFVRKALLKGKNGKRPSEEGERQCVGSYMPS